MEGKAAKVLSLGANEMVPKGIRCKPVAFLHILQ